MYLNIGSLRGIVKRRGVKLMILLLCLMLFIVGLVAVSYQIINPYKQYVIEPNPPANSTEVGLVLGAGVAQNGKPYEELQARLDSAANALDSGLVKKLVLSGDNRTQHYDEPTAMLKYLVNEKKIPEDKLQRDYAGRSTYESCERASKVFRVNKMIIFSAGSHLPRAIYLCRHFGIEAYGVSSRVEANNSTRREIMARVKAVYNAQLVGEQTVLGEPLPVY